MSKNVLVTGGAGFIGSHVAENLLSSGYNVTVLDNLSQGKREWVPAGVTFQEGDVTDLELMRRLCDGKDGVFHLAAMSRVLPSLGGRGAGALVFPWQKINCPLDKLVA